MKFLRQAELVVHLGAARTGTSALQDALRCDDRILRDEGIVCLTPEGFGYREDPTLRSFTRSVNAIRRRHGLSGYRAIFRARRELAALVGSTQVRRLVLSDENLLGPIFDKTCGKTLYPTALKSLAALARALKRAPDRIVLVVRPYDEFIASAYSMLAAYGYRDVHHDRVPAGLLDPDRGWPQVIDDISSVFPDTDLQVLRLERCAMDDVRVKMLGGAIRHDLSPIKRMNGSPSLAAIQATASRKPSRKCEIDDIIRLHEGSC